MTKVQSDLITLLRHALCGTALPEGFAVSDPEELYRLAHRHDLAHIVDQVLADHALLDPRAVRPMHRARAREGHF